MLHLIYQPQARTDQQKPGRFVSPRLLCSELWNANQRRPKHEPRTA